MSRCFPYLLLRNAVPGEALIESIKLQKVSEKSRTERSKEKREKKEKRKEKKRNEQQRLPSKAGDAKSSKAIATKPLAREKCGQDPYFLRGKEVEAEALEKSDVTEEHEQPMDSRMSCYMSDSKQSSNKRKRHSSPSISSNSSPSSCSRTHGNVLRFWVQQKHRELDAWLIKDQQCTPSGRANCVAQQNNPNQGLPFNNLETCTDIERVSSKSDDKIPHSTTGRDQELTQAEAASRTKPHKDERRWAKLCSKMDVFVPLAPQIEQNDGDDQWLFEAKPTKRCRAENDGMLCNRSAALTLWPSAHYLPVADIHALPYTVPF